MTSSQVTAAGPTGKNKVGWILLSATAPIIWGTTYIVTTHLLPPGHPLFAALMRTLPPGLVAIAIARALPKGSWWWKSLVLGGLNMAIFFPLLFITAARLPGGVAATLGAIQPVVIAFLASVILHEKLTVMRVLWGVAGVFGVALVVLGPDAALDTVGVIAGLASAFSMGTGVVLTKKWGRPKGVSAIGQAGWQLTGGGLLLLIPTLVFEGVPAQIDQNAIYGYLWLGTAGAIYSYSVWFAGIQKLSITPTALLGLFIPLTAAFLGAVIAEESLTPVQLLGFAIALSALVGGQLPGRKKTRQNS